jgi:hypothetical protein
MRDDSWSHDANVVTDEGFSAFDIPVIDNKLPRRKVAAWSAYWSKFYNQKTPKAELDRLMDTGRTGQRQPS